MVVLVAPWLFLVLRDGLASIICLGGVLEHIHLDMLACIYSHRRDASDQI